MEIRVIPAYPKYKACSNGDIIGPRGWILNPTLNDYGYLQVTIYDKDSVQITMRVHRLIASAFFDLDIFDKSIHVDHKDNNSTYNDIDNLQLLSISEHNIKTSSHYFTQDTDTHKLCRTCNTLLYRVMFSKDNSSRDGLNCRCRDCHSNIKRAKYKLEVRK